MINRYLTLLQGHTEASSIFRKESIPYLHGVRVGTVWCSYAYFTRAWFHRTVPRPSSARNWFQYMFFAKYVNVIEQIIECFPFRCFVANSRHFFILRGIVADVLLCAAIYYIWCEYRVFCVDNIENLSNSTRFGEDDIKWGECTSSKRFK